MKTITENVDVVVAGGGTAGHVAAIQSARLGVMTSVIEAGTMLGGTMTTGGVYMPNHFFNTKGAVVQDIPWELYTKSKEIEGLPVPDYRKRRPMEMPGYYSYINVPVYAAIAKEEALQAGVILHYHEFIAEIKADGNLEITSFRRGVSRVTKAKEIIDCSGDSDVVRMLRMFKFVRTSIPGCERATLKMMAPYALARETYHTLGEYLIQGDDFLKATDFEDKVCNAFNYIDMHSQETGCEVQFLESEDLLPKVPFRALIPKDSRRITVAGRNISANRVSFAGIRAQCTCMAMGQAIGAAALAVQRGVASREVNSKDIVTVTVEHGAVSV